MRENIHNTVLPIIYKNCIMNFIVADYAILFLKSEENIFSWNQFDEFLHEEFRQRLTLNILNSKPEKLQLHN